MKWISKVMVISIVLLGLAGMGYSWDRLDRPGFHGRGPGFRWCALDPKMMADLKLTPEQETKIEALRLQHLKDIKPLQEKMFSLSGDLRLLWLEKVPDEAKIMAVQKELRTVRDQIWDKTTAYYFKIRALLTPEQQRKFAAYPWMAGPGFGMGGYGRHGHGPRHAPPMEFGPCW